MTISTAVFAFCVACLASLILTPLVRRLAVRLRWRDTRDAEHKVRQAARPHAGGIALLVALLVSLWSVSTGFPEIAGQLQPVLLLVLPGVLLAAGIGLVDDLRGCRPIEKLLVQTAGAAVLVGTAATMPPAWLLAAVPIPGHLYAVALGLWIVGTTNATNLVDGADGLAPGLTVANALGLTVLAVIAGELAVGVMAAATAGCALGFLRSNRHPAKIYLGDSGSMSLGFALGALGAVLIARSASPQIALGVVLMGWVPWFDTIFAVVRRLASGESPFRPDRDHVHHRLVARGLPVAVAVRRLCALGFLATAAGIAVVVQAPAWPWLAALGLASLPLARVVLPLKVTVRVDEPRNAAPPAAEPASRPALEAAPNRAA